MEISCINGKRIKTSACPSPLQQHNFTIRLHEEHISLLFVHLYPAANYPSKLKTHGSTAQEKGTYTSYPPPLQTSPMGITACQSCTSIILFTWRFNGLQNCDLGSAPVHIVAVERFHKTFVFKQSQQVGSHAKIVTKNEQIDNPKSATYRTPKLIKS